jgi:hypothetical protein
VDQLNPAAILGLLKDAFTPQELGRFCYDHDEFREVLDQLGPDAGLNEMVHELLTYCYKRVYFQNCFPGCGTITGGNTGGTPAGSTVTFLKPTSHWGASLRSGVLRQRLPALLPNFLFCPSWGIVCPTRTEDLYAGTVCRL